MAIIASLFVYMLEKENITRTLTKKQTALQSYNLLLILIDLKKKNQGFLWNGNGEIGVSIRETFVVY